MFPQMTKIIPEAEQGVARVKHVKVDSTASLFTAIRGDYVPEGKYAQLTVNGDLMMSDTAMEHRSNYAVVSHAQGHVLIAGLGLGMILMPILKKTEVKCVTVIEKYQDVISLISPHFKSKKLNIICTDIVEWKPEKGAKYDTIYFDIWPDKCTDNLEEMATLHQRFKFYLNRSNPNRWMASWCRNELKARKRAESRYF